MTASLDGAQRTALSNLIQKARSLLEADLASTLEGDFGIHQSDGRVEEAAALSLDASQAAVRIDLLDIVAFLRSEGETEPAAVERLIREAAFTHVNRLVALRVAEGLGILPEAIGNGLASQGFRDFGEIAPASADEEWERFRLFVRICADELAADVPALFDPRNPLLELEPSTAAFSELIEFLVAVDETIWSAPDALGWSYQFFNSAEERKEMRESAAPRTSRELAVRNQFFTPSYVVEFLVQNGLGAHLAASYPALADELPLLVEVPQAASEAIDLREVSALDPACGSGHFLLGAYDVLEAAWRHAGIDPAVAAPDVVRSLWGIDIDPRATQIAQAAVILRARRHCRTPLPRPNVICARSLPATPEADDLIATLPPHVGRVVRAMADELALAPVLGPLLKIEERLDREARDAFGTGQIEGTLSEGVSEEDAANVESLVLETLATIADQTTSTASQRLFAAEAHDAVRFVEAMNRRYTTCLMNPPFGAAVETSKESLAAAYGSSSTDLYAAFVDRGLSLIDPLGSVGAITNRTGFFLSSLEQWRRDLLAHGIGCFADLGSFVLEDAQVEVAAYVLTRSSGPRPFIRAVLEKDKERVLRTTPDEFTFWVDPLQFVSLPGAWFDYWAGEELLNLFSTLPPLEDGERQVSRGISAGDNFRFLRLWWELDGASRGRGWAPVSKGGEFRRYFDEPHLRINWTKEAEPYGEAAGARIFNLDLQGRPGVYWPKRTTSLPSARPLPEGTMFEANSIPLFGPHPEVLLSFANSRLFAFLFLLQVGAADIARGSAAKDWITGPARRIPFSEPGSAARGELSRLVRRAVECGRSLAADSEISHFFHGSPRVVHELSSGRGWSEAVLSVVRGRQSLECELLEIEGESDALWIRIFDCSVETAAVLDRELEPQPSSLPRAHVDESEFRSAYLSRSAVAIGAARDDLRTRERAAKQTSDRSLRDLSQLFGVHPNVLVKLSEHHRLLRKTDEEQIAFELVSFLVGCGFGRWPTSAVVQMSAHGSPFEPVPESLADNWTVHGESDGFEMSARAQLVLVDQDGHVGDLASVVAQAGSEILGPSSALLSATSVLSPRGDLASLIRGQFFRRHLAMYSMSRRKAPIYWQLQVPSKTWGVWLYMPRLSRESLFAIVRETEQRQRLAEQRIVTLQRECDDGGAGRSLAAASKELDAEQKLAVELVKFRDEADRIANLGWEPDLDDGAVLNAAPLAALFPAWKEAAKYREEIKRGKHAWSSVSKYADQL